MSDKKSAGTKPDRGNAIYLFDPASIRDPSKAPEDAARLIWLVLGLIRGRQIAYGSYLDGFGRSEKTFRRDIEKLRKLGRELGFAIAVSERTVKLERLDGEPRKKADDEAERDALRGIAEALGRIVAESVSKIVDLGDDGDRFLRFAAPKLVDDSKVAETYRALREAWERQARVTFRFPDPRATAASERTVEPYFVSYHNGRYYLVAFDVRPRGGGWRQFPIDRIAGPVKRAGSFRPRPIAPGYARAEAVGLFKTGRASDPAVEVTIQLSARIAGAVCARTWQSHQRVRSFEDGSAHIVLDVYDLGEAVRWAFQFGIEAKVIAPAAAVELASEWTRAMSDSYAAPLPASSVQTA
jgi:predicted DNA-binding transcriptional regulator YafY